MTILEVAADWRYGMS